MKHFAVHDQRYPTRRRSARLITRLRRDHDRGHTAFQKDTISIKYG
jgi:hypothetical protein